MNETVSTTQTAPTAAGEAAMRALQHVGAAYALIFVLVAAYAWRATAASRRLAERLDDLERDPASR